MDIPSITTNCTTTTLTAITMAAVTATGWFSYWCYCRKNRKTLKLWHKVHTEFCHLKREEAQHLKAYNEYNAYTQPIIDKTRALFAERRKREQEQQSTEKQQNAGM